MSHPAFFMFYVYASIISIGLFSFFTLLFLQIYLFVKCNYISRRLLAASATIFAFLLVTLWEPFVAALYTVPNLCQIDGGQHVYDTTKADGFYLLTMRSEYLKEYGFKYVESMSFDVPKGYIVTILDSKGDLSSHRLSGIDSLVSIYTYIENDYIAVPGFPNIGRKVKIVKNRITGKVLGETVEYSYLGGNSSFVFYSMLGGRDIECWSSERKPSSMPIPVVILR